MKTVILIFLMSAAFTVLAQTTEPIHKTHAGTVGFSSVNKTNENMCCRYPLRAFGDATPVNLTLLFKWWEHRGIDGLANTDSGTTNSRPLAAWHRITGKHVGDAESSWVVEAEIYTNPGVRIKARIMLKNPPIAEEQLFYSLKTGLAAALQQMTNDQRVYQADTKAAQKAQARAKPARNTRNARNLANEEAQVASQDQQSATTALNDQKQLEQAVPAAQKRLNAIPSKNGKYVLDVFALLVGKTKAGVPIYDLGMLDINSP